jgi:CRISPR-associated protein Cas5d
MSERSDGLFVEDNRQQRAGLFLKDVRYRFFATLEYIPLQERKHLKFRAVPAFLHNPNEKDFLIEEQKMFEDGVDTVRKDETPGKYLAIFERRASKGQCFNQPYLGCREFSCNFEFIKSPRDRPATAISESRDLGFMLYDMDFKDLDNPQPMFFRAELKDGVIHVPERDSEEVRR